MWQTGERCTRPAKECVSSRCWLNPSASSPTSLQLSLPAVSGRNFEAISCEQAQPSSGGFHASGNAERGLHRAHSASVAPTTASGGAWQVFEVRRRSAEYQIEHQHRRSTAALAGSRVIWSPRPDGAQTRASSRGTSARHRILRRRGINKHGGRSNGVLGLEWRDKAVMSGLLCVGSIATSEWVGQCGGCINMSGSPFGDSCILSVLGLLR